DLGMIDLLGENGLIQLGAVEQRAEATNDGDAFAGSGAVTDTGAIAIDNNPGTDVANATVDLGPLLEDAGADEYIETLALEVGALAATASQVDGNAATSQYMIADLGIEVESELVSGLYTTLQTQITSLQTLVNALDGALDGALNLGIDGIASATA